MAGAYAAGLLELIREQDTKLKRLRMLLEDVRAAHLENRSIEPLLGDIEQVCRDTADLDQRVRSYIKANRSRAS